MTKNKKKKLLIGPGTIITFGQNNRILENSGILVEEGEIKEVESWKELINRNTDAEILDADGRVIIPGIINAHMHFYSTFARGMKISSPPGNFNEILENLWWKLDKALMPEDCYLSAAIPIIQGIKKGVTTYLDHHSSPFYRNNSPAGSLDEVAQAVIDNGVRACLCCEVSDRDGEIAALTGISENERFIEMCRSGHGGGRLSGMIGLHAQFTLSDDTLDSIRQLDEYERAGIHIHCAESIADVDDSKQRGWSGVIDRLADFQLLNDKTILAHCVHITDSEMEKIAAAKSAVVHQPISNMNNAVGAADVIGMMNAGITVGVGTDGISANVLDDFKTASWMMRHRSEDPSVGWIESAELLMKGNPDIASRFFEKPVGIIKAGANADIAVMDYYPPTPLNEDSVTGHLLFGISGADAYHTICAGNILLKAKQMVKFIDEEALAEKAREHAKDLWERL